MIGAEAAIYYGACFVIGFWLGYMARDLWDRR